MKLSYNEACTLHNSNLEQDLLLSDQAGFEYMELRIDKLKEYLETKSLRDLKSFFDAHRIKPNTINGTYVYADFLSDHDDEARRDALLSDIRFACEVGRALGVDSMVVVPDLTGEADNLPYPLPWPVVFENTVRIFSKLADYVAPYGMNLAMEMVGSHRCSVRTVEQAREIVAAVDKENVGYTIDAFNLYLYDKLNDFSCLRLLDPKKIFVVHINNGEDVPLAELRQMHRTFCNQGGAIDLENFIANLAAIGYDGTVSIEFFRKDCWEAPAEWVVNECYRTTRDELIKNGVLR